MLVHDDASIDQTAKIIEKYAKKYPDIIKPIYQDENQYSKGESILRKFIYLRIKGKYIAICEGDDYWIDPLKLQKQVEIMEHNLDISMCCHDALVMWENKVKQPRLFAPEKLPSILGLEDILKDWVVPTASILFRSEIKDTLPQWKVVNGDYLLQLWCTTYGKIYYIDEVMSVYRKDFGGNAVSTTQLYDNKYRFEKYFELLDLFNQETNFVHNDLIEKTKKNKRRNFRYSQSKRKFGLFHYILKPHNTLKKLTHLIKKN